MSVRKRGENWHYQFMYRRQRYYGVLDTAETKTDAKTLEAEELRKVRRGERSSRPENFQLFVDEVYLKYSKENKQSWKHDEFRCQMLCEFFGKHRLSEITGMMVTRFIKTRLSSKIKRYRQKSAATRLRSPVTVHKEVTLLSSIFLMAIREKVPTTNPVADVSRTVRRMIKPRNRRRCTMDNQREADLIEKGLVGRNTHLRPIVLFELNTGLRSGELRRLEVQHFNFDPKVKRFEIDGQSYEVPMDCFIVTKSKNGRPRVMPLNSSARAIAQHQANDATVTTFLFPSYKKKGSMIQEVKKGFQTACETAGLMYGQYNPDGITFHTLRHWFNSKLAGLGVNKTVRRDLLGHTPGDITDDYTHSTIEQRRQAVELLCHTKPEKVLEFRASVA